MQHDSPAHSAGSLPSADRSTIESLKREVDYYIRTDASRALEIADEAYRLALRTDDLPARALGFRAKAQALHVGGRYEEAIALYTEARRIYATQGRRMDAARVGRSLADALMYLGRYEESLRFATEARRTFIDLNEAVLAAQTDTNMGNVYHRLDRYEEALERYESAMQVFRDSDESVALAVALFNTANIRTNLDDFRTAETLYRAAHDIYQREGMALAAAQTKYSLGYLDFLKGAYHPAMRTLHEVVELFRQLGDRRFQMLCALDLAEICLQLNLLEETMQFAVEANREAESLRQRYEAAKAQAYLGLASMRASDFAAAEAFLLRAQSMFRDEGNEIHEGLAGIYLAELAILRHRPAEALELAEKAQAVFERRNLNVKKWYAALIVARAAALCGDGGRAMELANSILAGSENDDVPWLKYQIHELLGSLAAPDAAAATHHYQKAVEFVERMRSGICVDEFRSTFFRNKLPIYDKLIELCLMQAGSGKLAEAFFYLESQKGRTLVDLVDGEGDLRGGAAEAGPELRARWQQLREELHWHYSRSVNEETGGLRRVGAGARREEQIRLREQSLAELSRQIQQLDPNFVAMQRSSGITLERLREALAADETVVEYYFQGEKLRIFVIDRDQLRLVDSPVSRSDINAAIFELKFHLDKLNYGTRHVTLYGNRLMRSFNDCLHRLYQALVEPAAELLTNRRIVFVPFETLHAVPFPALFDGTAYLADHHEIGLAPSARLFAACAGRAADSYRRGLVVGWADEQAPEIRQEVDAIRNRLPDSIALTDNDATAAALRREAPAAGVIHIASHAVFRQDSPMFSALKLADGWLNCYDIASLRLPSTLVILSGCRTGASGVRAGDELSGLVRAFLAAGAASLVVSLWSVSDSATAMLMNAFYERLQAGLTPRAALRAASLAIKEDNPNPLYWAPFVFVGGR